MFKILTLNKISQSGLSVLDKNCYEISDNVENPDAVIVRSFAMHEWNIPQSLKAIARAGAGVNNIPIDKCSDNGIVVFNTPGANANAVKELVIAGLLMSSRKIVQGINWSTSLKGQTEVAKTVEKGKANFTGPEISGKTIGVIGAGGAIGLRVSNACIALGMKVIGYDPFISDKAKSIISPEVKITDNLDEVYANSDYISLHLPYNAETKHLINENTLAKCKKGVRILNFARGELVCNESIKNALANGTAACYVTDFPDENVVDVDGIITVPHLGASTPESEENCAVMASEQIKKYLETGNIVNSVNFPFVDLEFGGNRICVAYKQNDSFAETVKNLLADKGFNHKLFFESKRGNLGYLIIEYTDGDAAEIIDEINKLEGLLFVRNINK